MKIWSHSAELNHLVSSIAPVFALLFHRGLIFQPLWVLFLSVHRVFLFSADGGHPATKRQRSKIAAVAIPANHSGHSDRWNLVPPLLVPLYPSVLSFVLEGHQIQSAECLSFRGAEKTAFILLSLWPYIKALELEESTMGEKASQGHAGKWLLSGDAVVYFLVNLSGFGWCPWKVCSYEFLKQAYSSHDFHLSNLRTNFCLWFSFSSTS